MDGMYGKRGVCFFMPKIVKLAISAALAAMLATIITLSAYASGISEYVFIDNTHAASQVPGAVSGSATIGQWVAGNRGAAMLASGTRPQFEARNSRFQSMRSFVIFVIVAYLIFLVFYLPSKFSKNRNTKKPFAPAAASNKPPPVSQGLSPVELRTAARGLTKVFDRQRFSREDDLIQAINVWLAGNPQIGNITCEIDIGHRLGFLVNKYSLSSVTLRYDILDNMNTYQYAIVLLENFGLYRKNPKTMLADWQTANPNTTVLYKHMGSNMRGRAGAFYPGGIGATNLVQLYVFFKFPVKRAPTHKTVSASESSTGTQEKPIAVSGQNVGSINGPVSRRFCTYCGTKAESDDSFCGECGKKLRQVI